MVYNAGGSSYYWLDMIEGRGDGLNLDDPIVTLLYKVTSIHKRITSHKFHHKVFIFLFFFISLIKV